MLVSISNEIQIFLILLTTVSSVPKKILKQLERKTGRRKKKKKKKKNKKRKNKKNRPELATIPWPKEDKDEVNDKTESASLLPDSEYKIFGRDDSTQTPQGQIQRCYTLTFLSCTVTA